MSLLQSMLADRALPLPVRQEAWDRMQNDPGLPLRDATTKSFWLQEPHPSIAQAQSEVLVDEVDVAIIGSGVTGLAVAHTLLTSSREHNTPAPTVVMLEARDTCSGATGRNGGHVLETANNYSLFKRLHGREAAEKLIRFSLAHLPALNELATATPALQEHTQMRKVEFVCVFFDEVVFKEAVKGLLEFKDDMPKESSLFSFHTGEALIKDFHCSPHVVGVITGPAGAVWPYRFVTELLADLKRQHGYSFRLETSTPVTTISLMTEPGRSTSHPYTISTPRGELRARHIVHCTNGHIGHLVPGLRGRVAPVRGQMSAQGPGALFSHQSNRSWLFIYDSADGNSSGLDYLTQLPGSGEMMFGGGLAALPARGLGEVGVTTDDVINLHADIHLSGALEAVFGREHWGASEGVKEMWTGIMGFSVDEFPWVGELPEDLTGRGWKRTSISKDAEDQVGCKENGGEWVAAGYSGHGMVQAWCSGKAVAQMILVREGKVDEQDVIKDLDGLPEEFKITKERLARTSLHRPED